MEITETDQALLDWVMLYGMDGEVKTDQIDEYFLETLWINRLIHDLTPNNPWYRSIFQLNQRAKDRLKEIQNEY